MSPDFLVFSWHEFLRDWSFSTNAGWLIFFPTFRNSRSTGIATLCAWLSYMQLPWLQRSVLEIQRNLDITNDFLYPSNSKIYEKGTPIWRNLVIANKCCQFLGPLLNRGSTVPRMKNTVPTVYCEHGLFHPRPYFEEGPLEPGYRSWRKKLKCLKNYNPQKFGAKR